MSRRNEKRSSTARTDSRCPLTVDMFGGVGGRQASPRRPSQGGGYQNKCTVLNFDPRAAEKKRDPRLEELREMGLQRIWLEVAEKIGVDDFLAVWRILDSDQSSIDNCGRLMVPIRVYGTYLRYQRNRYAESLMDQGVNPREIHKKLREQLGEKISMSTIFRIKKGHKKNV